MRIINLIINRKVNIMSANFKKITIGRDSKNQVVLSDSSVSRMHAELFIDNEGNAFLTDMNSSNGTTVNGSRISGTVQLKKKDVVMLGSVKYAWENEVTPKVQSQPVYSPPPSSLPPPPPVSGSSNQKMMYWMAGTVVLLALLAGVLFFLNQDDETEDELDKSRNKCITIAEIINGKGEKGDCCEGCEDNQEIPTKKGSTVYIKNGEIKDIKEKVVVEDDPKVKNGGGEIPNPPKGENPKAGGGGKDDKQETKKGDDPDAPGKLVNGKWKAGKGDDGLDAMTRNINAATGKNWTSEQIRQANGRKLEGKNPTILKKELYNLPNK